MLQADVVRAFINWLFLSAVPGLLIPTRRTRNTTTSRGEQGIFTALLNHLAYAGSAVGAV
jgi:hypothetical protein